MFAAFCAAIVYPVSRAKASTLPGVLFAALGAKAEN